MQENAYFNKRKFLAKVAIESTPYALSWQQIEQGVEQYLQRNHIVQINNLPGKNVCYTTKEMLELEEKLLKQADYMATEISHPCSDKSLQKAISKRTLTSEQEEALKYIINSDGRIKILSGLAGTGKSYLLNAAREVWENNNYQVIGASLSAKVARSMEDDALIASSTIHKLLWAIDKGKTTLDEKTVVVIDEAGMVNTRHYAKLMEHIDNAGAKLLLAGDYKQLQAIQAGGVKKKLMERVGYKELSNITRQQEQWARTAVKQIAEGKVKESLQAYIDRGLLHLGNTKEEAKYKLIDDWSKFGGIFKPRQNLILAGLREEVKELNRLSQLSRKEAGLIKDKNIRVNGQKIHVGDRVVLTRNDLQLDVFNGQFGSVKTIKGKKLVLNLDNGQQRTIDTKQYDHVELGYATTTHKAQGITCENAYVLMGGDIQDLQMSYVQVSRAKNTTRLYAQCIDESPQRKIESLIKDIEYSRIKDMAVHIKEQSKGYEL